MADPRRLIILDLNGTLLHRLTHEAEFKQFRQHPIVIKHSISTNVTINGSKILFRPHATDFLHHLLSNFDVAVWTSAQPRNAFPMVHYSFFPLLKFSSLLELGNAYALTPHNLILGPSEREALRSKDSLLDKTKDGHALKFVWTQNECDTIEQTLAPGQKFVKPLRKKDLAKVYASFPDCYSPENTFIIDDSEEKISDHRQNHLIIPEFSVLNEDVDFTKDNVLLHLKRYLCKLLTENPQDIRHFLTGNTFKDFISERQ